MYILLLILCGYLIFEIIRSANILKITHTDILIKNLSEDLKIVLISDLHEKRFGKNNEKLAEMILNENPDFIAFPGDMSDSYKAGFKAFTELLDSLGGKIPVYASAGNHDLRLGDGADISDDLKKTMKEQGVHFLHSDFEVFKNIRIYGYVQPLDYLSSVKIRKRNLKNVTAGDIEEALGKKHDMPVILLSHDPHQFDAYAGWGADLTLAGHIHGGVVRIPLFGGVLSPHFRFFPNYTAGLYEKNGCKMFVGRGLGRARIPRVWNSPEVCVIHLKKE